ncbi:hypothetical protein GCM10010422_23720 [Streptomyces graminearus]|uniref:Uncharacterized protein n=1 Tax=Streptomyces graminearus TaxID=284030 RepID=A0ABN3L6L2_9ACTN
MGGGPRRAVRRQGARVAVRARVFVGAVGCGGRPPGKRCAIADRAPAGAGTPVGAPVVSVGHGPRGTPGGRRAVRRSAPGPSAVRPVRQAPVRPRPPHPVEPAPPHTPAHPATAPAPDTTAPPAAFASLPAPAPPNTTGPAPPTAPVRPSPSAAPRTASRRYPARL